MTTALTALRSQILPHAPTANDITIDRTLVETARDFCTFTRAWRTTISETVTAGTLAVALTPPTNGELVDVITAVLDGAPLVKKTQSQLDAIDPEWRTSSSTSRWLTMDDTLNQVLIAPLSGTTYTSGLSVRVAWKPTLAATVLDEKLASRYPDALIAGALHRLLSIPNQSWSNGGLAAYYGGRYDLLRDEAKQASTDGGMKGVVRKVKYGGL